MCDGDLMNRDDYNGRAAHAMFFPNFFLLFYLDIVSYHYKTKMGE